jgi:hypothetical protein
MARGAAVSEGPCEEEVCELAARFWKLKFLSGEEQFAEATEIGFMLRAWRDEFWAESSRLCWWEEHLRIPAEAVPWLIRLCDNRQRLLADRRRALPAVRFVPTQGELTACGEIMAPSFSSVR